MDKFKRFIPIGIGVLLAIIIILLAFGMLQNVFTRAADTKPADVVVANITQNSAKVTWSSAIETQGVIEYGTSPTALNFFAPESQKTKDHSVDLTLLSQNTTYYLDIRIGDKKYDNEGIPWSFTTKSTAQTCSGLVSPALSPARPTPVQILQISPAAGTSTTTCPYTDCATIKANFGKSGCDTQAYFKCIKKLTPTP